MSSRARIAFLFALSLCTGLAWALAHALGGRHVAFTLAGQRLELLTPEALSLAAALPLLVFTAYQSFAVAPPAQRTLSLALRCLLVATLACALGRVVRVRDSEKLSVVIAVDVSDSIDDAQRDGQLIARSHAQAQNAYPTEYAALRSNEPLLAEAARRSGGHARPSADQIWRPALAPPSNTRRSVAEPRRNRAGPIPRRPLGAPDTHL